MAGLLCGTKRKKQGNLVLMLGFWELESGKGEAGSVTSSALKADIQQCIVLVVVRVHHLGSIANQW